MARPATAVERIRKRIEPYLDGAEQAWRAQPEGRRVPTLPHTPAPERKVNVTELCRQAGLCDNDTQYFHKPRYQELRDLVNVFAQAQGLKPIGARTPGQPSPEDGWSVEEEADSVIQRLEKDRSRQAGRNAQAQARVAFLERELAEARERNTILQRRLAHAQNTGVLIRNGEET